MQHYGAAFKTQCLFYLEHTLRSLSVSRHVPHAVRLARLSPQWGVRTLYVQCSCCALKLQDQLIACSSRWCRLVGVVGQAEGLVAPCGCRCFESTSPFQALMWHISWLKYSTKCQQLAAAQNHPG
jgi:hypothetical protein